MNKCKNKHSILKKVRSKSLWLCLLISFFCILKIQAFIEAELDKRSSDSAEVRLVIDQSLIVHAPEDLSINHHKDLIDDHMTNKRLCVLGEGMDHYKLSVSSDSNIQTSKNIPNQKVSYLLNYNKLNQNIPIPQGNSNKDLWLDTDITCDDAPVISVKTEQNTVQKNLTGVVILNVGVE